MVFFGLVNVGQSLAALTARAANLDLKRKDLKEQVKAASEARRTVVAEIGEELKVLGDLERSL